MGKVNAFRHLLYALSRIPGLGFLYSAASAVNSAEYVGHNVTAAKDAAGNLKKEVKKDDEKKEER
jgi:hypothetical protein